MPCKRVRPPVGTIFWGLAAICLAAAGCAEPPSPASESIDLADPTVEPAGEPDRQSWQIITLGGNRVGYASTSHRHIEHDGEELVRIDGLTVLRVQRFGQTTEQRMQFTDVQTPDGKLVRLSAEVWQGEEPMTLAGAVDGDRLELEIGTLGKTTQRSVPWSDESGGFHTVEESLARAPMQPGDRRRLTTLLPGMAEPAEVELTAAEREPVTLPGGEFELLRIDNVTHFGPGQQMRSALWTDPDGEVLKTWTETLNLETYRVPKAVALAEIEPAELDLGLDPAVKVRRPIANPHSTRRIQYRLELDDGDPAEKFLAGPSQRVVPVGPHAAEVTVYALRPGVEGNAAAPPETPGEYDLRPSNMIQSDDPKIVRLAREAAGHEDDPWRKAVALERFVYGYVTEKDYSQAFATAAEVARQREGDCTEHAVLLAALCRAAGIPARVAAGLVYLPPHRSFFFHMWTEAYVDGRFIPLDATLGRGGIGAAHLKLTHTSLEDTTAYTAFLPILRVIGRLNIDVLEVQ